MSSDVPTRAEPGRVTLAVSGMTCGGCANAVRRALTRVPGVAGAEVDLAQGRATVQGSAPADALVAAVAAAGYGVQLV
jgi:copper chaperone CopZ